LVAKGVTLECSAPLNFFIANTVTQGQFTKDALKTFMALDDIDILSAIKRWQHHSDFVLSQLCDRILNRDLLKIDLKDKPIAPETFNSHFKAYQEKHKLTEEETAYLVFKGEIENKAYNQKYQNINILLRNGVVSDVS